MKFICAAPFTNHHHVINWEHLLGPDAKFHMIDPNCLATPRYARDLPCCGGALRSKLLSVTFPALYKAKPIAQMPLSTKTPVSLQIQ